MALPLHNGTKMVRFDPGDRDRTAQSASVMNEFCDVCDALLNIKILKASRGQKNSVVIANNGVVFTIADGTGGESSVRYRLEYDPAADPPYLFGDMVRVSPSNAASSTTGGPSVPGLYICIEDEPTEDDPPTHPLQPGGESEFWHHLATWPSELKVCNADTNQIEVWLIDGQKKPEVTVDDSRISVDDDSITVD